MKRILIALVRFYQKFISRSTAPRCKYYPTCSNYTIEALNEYGVLKGILKSIYRILRCNPFSKGGYDPVISNKLNEGKNEWQ